MQKVSIVDIQHKQFKKKLNGYDPADVDQFLDEVIESLEDDATARAALEAEVADMKERISHFKSMEESLQNTLLLAQRTADEVKASAHKEADLIRAEARVAVEKEIARYGDKSEDARRELRRRWRRLGRPMRFVPGGSLDGTDRDEVVPLDPVGRSDWAPEAS